MSLFDSIIQEVVGRFESAIIRSYNGSYISCRDIAVLDIGGHIINIWLRDGAICVGNLSSYGKFPLVSLDIDMVCEYIMNIMNTRNSTPWFRGLRS